MWVNAVCLSAYQLGETGPFFVLVLQVSSEMTGLLRAIGYEDAARPRERGWSPGSRFKFAYSDQVLINHFPDWVVRRADGDILGYLQIHSNVPFVMKLKEMLQ